MANGGTPKLNKCSIGDCNNNGGGDKCSSGNNDGRDSVDDGRECESCIGDGNNNGGGDKCGCDNNDCRDGESGVGDSIECKCGIGDGNNYGGGDKCGSGNNQSIKEFYYKIVALESELRNYLHLKLLTNVSRPQYMLSLLCYNNRYVFK